MDYEPEYSLEFSEVRGRDRNKDFGSMNGSLLSNDRPPTEQQPAEDYDFINEVEDNATLPAEQPPPTSFSPIIKPVEIIPSKPKTPIHIEQPKPRMAHKIQRHFPRRIIHPNLQPEHLSSKASQIKLLIAATVTSLLGTLFSFVDVILACQSKTNTLRSRAKSSWMM